MSFSKEYNDSRKNGLLLSVCHLTSVHPRYDSRIFHKMCCSLAKHSMQVSLVVADGLGDEVKDGVSIKDIGAPKGRLNRMLYTSKVLYKEAIVLGADIYHIHDPELLFVGLLLQRRGMKVIFDSHEDVGNTILVSPYLPSFLTKFISFSYKKIEKFICKKLDGVIAATPYIEHNFSFSAKRTITINNYPILKERANNNLVEKNDEVCYVGSIDLTRGIHEMVESLKFVRSDVKLNLAGQFSVPTLEEEIKKHNCYHLVNNYGHVDKKEVEKIYSRSVVGLVTLHPIPTYLVSQPIKIFEYMEAGIPFIISDFPYWKQLLKGCNCCRFVDPLDSKAIAGAIDFFISNKHLAEQMGKEGQEFVYERFNWLTEEQKLVSFYNKISVCAE